MNLAVMPLGQSTLTAAWNSTAQTNHNVRKKENRPCGCCTYKGNVIEEVIVSMMIQFNGREKITFIS